MASVIEFRLPIEQFALAHTVHTIPDVAVEIERFAAQDPDTVTPFVWVTADDSQTFKEAVVDDPSVEDCSLLADLETGQFYRMDWAADTELVVHLILEKESAIMSAHTNGEEWQFKVLCPGDNAMSEMYDFCENNGLSLSVDAIYDLTSDDSTQYGLTDSQLMSLMRAREMGFYEVPRAISLSDLADELNVSHQALSERLRRGHANLIDQTLRTDTHAQSEPPSDL